MKLTIRLAILLLALAGLVYGFTAEMRDVRPIGADDVQEVDALEFVLGTTQDAYFLRDGKLNDTYSLVPAFAQVKDCKT